MPLIAGLCLFVSKQTRRGSKGRPVGPECPLPLPAPVPRFPALRLVTFVQGYGERGSGNVLLLLCTREQRHSSYNRSDCNLNMLPVVAS